MIRLLVVLDSKRNGPCKPLQPAATGITESRSNTVLVVDYDSTVREMMRRYLAREKFHVVTAADGDEGLRIAKRIVPSVITLDVVMREMDGFEFLFKLEPSWTRSENIL
jgi:DNA-binding response OmpR family regulator